MICLLKKKKNLKIRYHQAQLRCRPVVKITLNEENSNIFQFLCGYGGSDKIRFNINGLKFCTQSAHIYFVVLKMGIKSNNNYSKVKKLNKPLESLEYTFNFYQPLSDHILRMMCFSSLERPYFANYFI